MAAFQAAVDLGYRYLETDARPTADGVLLAFHDERLDRVTDRTGAVARRPWHEVREARVAGTDPIPLLEDVLGSWPDVRVNLDPKSDAAVDPLIEVLRRTGAVDRVCITSFAGRRIRRMRHALGEGLCVGAGPLDVARLLLAGLRLPVGGFEGDCVQVPTAVGPLPVLTARFVEAAHERDLHVHVWTIDEEDEMHRLLDLGVDGIMTDRPAALRSVLEARGAWS